MNAIKNSRRFCKCCNHETKFERNTTVWGFGDFIMIFPTFGGWLLIRFLWDAIRNPWRCATCGSTVPLAMPTELPPSGQLYAGFLVLVFGVLGVRALSANGCSNGSTAPPSAVPSPLVPPTVAAVEPAPPVDAGPPSRSRQFSGSLARFTNSQINECVDITIIGDSPEDAGPDWQPSAGFDAMLKSDKELRRLTRLCAEQFADRTVLASCFATVDREVAPKRKVANKAAEAVAAGYTGRVKVLFTSRYYDYADVGIKDDRMSECLEMKGDWKPLSRESREFEAAKSEYTRRKLQKAVENLNP